MTDSPHNSRALVTNPMIQASKQPILTSDTNQPIPNSKTRRHTTTPSSVVTPPAQGYQIPTYTSWYTATGGYHIPEYCSIYDRPTPSAK